jgi:hypothetical protein
LLVETIVGVEHAVVDEAGMAELPIEILNLVIVGVDTETVGFENDHSPPLLAFDVFLNDLQGDGPARRDEFAAGPQGRQAFLEPGKFFLDGIWNSTTQNRFYQVC